MKKITEQQLQQLLEGKIDQWRQEEQLPPEDLLAREFPTHPLFYHKGELSTSLLAHYTLMELTNTGRLFLLKQVLDQMTLAQREEFSLQGLLEEASSA